MYLSHFFLSIYFLFFLYYKQKLLKITHFTRILHLQNSINIEINRVLKHKTLKVTEIWQTTSVHVRRLASPDSHTKTHKPGRTQVQQHIYIHVSQLTELGIWQFAKQKVKIARQKYFFSQHIGRQNKLKTIFLRTQHMNWTDLILNILQFIKYQWWI